MSRKAPLIPARSSFFFTPTVNVDATNKLYVDQRRAPAVVFYDLPRQHVPIPGRQLVVRPIASVVAISRSRAAAIRSICMGDRLRATVSDYPPGTLGYLAGIRFVNGTPERIAWLYGAGPPDNLACGFTVSMTARLLGTDINVPIEGDLHSAPAAPLRPPSPSSAARP